MSRTIIRTAVLLVSVLASTAGYAATVTWNLPSSYADGTPIPPDEVRRIVVKVYAGPSKTGPWKWVATSMPGATSAAVLDPGPGRILWYTAKSSLHGMDSDYAVPVRWINLSFPIVPTARKILKWAVTPKKMAALSVLFLLTGAGCWIRRRRKRKRGAGREAVQSRSTTPAD